jgi:hypothetical protein
MAKLHDPRSEAEKARADLKRNAEMGSATQQAPFTRQPSVTPDTFGEHGGKARVLSGTGEGLEAGGARPPTTPGAGASESVAEAEQVSDGRDHTKPVANQGGQDALSRTRA